MIRLAAGLYTRIHSDTRLDWPELETARGCRNRRKTGVGCPGLEPLVVVRIRGGHLFGCASNRFSPLVTGKTKDIRFG